MYTYDGKYNHYVPFEAGKEHFNRTIKHIEYVQDLGRRLGVQHNLLTAHDASKFSMYEFPVYAKHFYAGGDEYFPVAVNHHYRANPHHWNHWVVHHGFPHSNSPILSNMALEMPHPYVDEMLVDWMAVQYEKNKTHYIFDWLNKNKNTMYIHELTWEYLFNRLKEWGINE